MADENTLNKIMDGYEELRIKSALEREKRIEEVKKKVPRIYEIDCKIFELGFNNTKNIFENPEKKDEYNAQFSAALKSLNEEKESLIKEYGINPDYDKFLYECQDCSDTGYTPDGKKCKCFKQRLINEAYSMSNMSEIIKKQNFNTFSFDYYSKTSENGAASPYENMVRIYNSCKRFCEDFDSEVKSMLFYGPTGLGKTFLSSAVAKELMDKGKTVVYTRATRFFAMNEDYKFGRNTDKSVIDSIYNADLLIIDDLGTEPYNKNSIAFLFDVVNERLAEDKKMIINTNLQINEITKLYSARFTSRLYEYFILYKFYGEDIRIQKLKNGTV